MPTPALTAHQIPLIVARVHADELATRVQPTVRATVDFFGKKVITDVGASVETWRLSDPKVASFLRDYGATRVRDLYNQTTQDRLRDVLAQGVEEGRTYAQVADDIGHVFDVAEGSRAYRIAETEIVRASNFAAVEGMRQAEIEEKEWQAVEDAYTRETHAALDGTVVGIDDVFQSEDGGAALYPGDFGEPEEDVNCRCGVLPVFQQERRVRTPRAVLKVQLLRARLPYQRKMRTQLQAGFRAQRAAVLETFNHVAVEAA